MTLCPIAIAVGCRKCAVFSVCPVKGIIGDYKKEDDKPAASKDTPKGKSRTCRPSVARATPCRAGTTSAVR